MKGGTELAIETEPYFNPDLVRTCTVAFTAYRSGGDIERSELSEEFPSEARTTTAEGSVLSGEEGATMITFVAPRWPADSIARAVRTKISVSFNGQDFDRTEVDEATEDTLFTYHRDIVLKILQPPSGPVSGGTKLKIVVNFNLMEAWTPFISFRGKRDITIRGEVVDGSIICATPSYSSKMGKWGFEDVRICVSLNGYDFSGDAMKGSTSDDASGDSRSRKEGPRGHTVEAEKIFPKERFRFYHGIEELWLSPDHGTCNGGSKVTIAGCAGSLDRKGTRSDGLPDTGAPYLVQLRYIDEVGVPRSIDRQGIWSNGTVTFTAPMLQPAQEAEVTLAPNRQDFSSSVPLFTYVPIPELLGISPRMAPLSFATEITLELSQKVGSDCRARLRFPCGNASDESDISTDVLCTSVGKGQRAMTCKLPLPSVHENVPRFIAFVASHLARRMPIEVAVDGQNFRPAGNLIAPATGMQLYMSPDVKSIEPCGGPFDAKETCTLMLSRDYFAVRGQESTKGISPAAASRDIDVKFVSTEIGQEIVVSAVVQGSDIIKLECPRLGSWPEDVLNPFKAEVWLSIRDEKFCPTGFSYLFYPHPAFTDVSPRVGHFKGGTPLIITGERFCDLGFGCTVVKIGRALTIGTVLDDETIRCVSPMMPPGKYDIEVSFNGISFHPLTIESGGPKAAPFKFIVGDIINMEIEPQMALGPVTGGSALSIIFMGNLVSLLPKNTDMAVHFRTSGASASIEGQFSKKRVKRSGAKILVGEVRCTTPPFQNPSFATVHLSFCGMEESASAACTFTFHRIPEITNFKPDYVPTLGGSHIKAQLKIARMLPKESEGKVSPQVKFCFSSDGDRPHEATVESEYDALTGQFFMAVPAWPSAEKVSLKVSLNGGADYTPLDSLRLKYFDQPLIFEGLTPSGGPILGSTEIKLKLPESVVTNGHGTDITVAFHFPHSKAEKTLFRNVDATIGADVVLRTGLKVSGSVVQCEVPECASEIDLARVLISLNGSDFIGKRQHGSLIPFHVPFTYYYPPTFDAVEPLCCSNDGGTTITIRGIGFHRLGKTYQGAKVQFLTSKSVARTVDAIIVSDGVVECIAPKIRSYDGLVKLRLSLNGQQYTEVTSLEEEEHEADTQIRYHHCPVLVMNVTGSCEGGEEVVFRGPMSLLAPALDDGIMTQINFVSTSKGSKFTRTVDAFIKAETNTTLEIACITPKVPTPVPARLEIVLKDRAEAATKETVILKLKYRYNFFPPPELVSIHPFGGPIGGGTQILISSQYIGSKKAVTVNFEYIGDDDMSSEPSVNSIEERRSALCTVLEASTPQEKLKRGLICSFPDFSDLFDANLEEFARFNVDVVVNGIEYHSSLSYTAYRVPANETFEIRPKIIFKGHQSTLAVSMRQSGFFPDEGSWVHLRLTWSGGASAGAVPPLSTLYILGQVDQQSVAVFQCPQLISAGSWGCELSFNAIDYMRCGDIEVREPALVLCMLPSKLSVQLSSHITIACRATSPSTSSLLSGGRIRVKGMKRSESMLSDPLHAISGFSKQQLHEAVRDKLHISQLRVTLLDVDIERSRENHQIIVFLSCNGTTIALSPGSKREKRSKEAESPDGPFGQTSSTQLPKAEHEPTTMGAKLSDGAVRVIDLVAKSQAKRRQSAFLPNITPPQKSMRGSPLATPVRSEKKKQKTGSFSVITTNSVGLNAADVASHSSAMVKNDAQTIQALMQGCHAQAHLDLGDQPVDVNTGIIEVSVVSIFQDPIELQPTSCSVIATGEFPCKHLADSDGLFDDFTFRCALDQAVKTQLQIPIARSATFDLEVTKGQAPPDPDFLFRAEFPPFRDVFGTDTARINVDLCGQSNNNPIAVMSPARRIAVFDPHSWSILGIEPTEGRATSSTPVVLDVSGFQLVEKVSLRIELEDGMLLHQEAELVTVETSAGISRRTVRATMPALKNFTGEYVDASVNIVTDGMLLCTSKVRFMYITTPSISGISPTHLPHTSGGMVTIYGIGFIAREQTHAILESYDNGKWRVDPETYNLNASMCGSRDASASQIWSNDADEGFDDDIIEDEFSEPQNGPNPYLLETLTARPKPLNFVTNEDGKVVIETPLRFINQSSIEVRIPPHLPTGSLVLCLPGTDGQDIRSKIALSLYDATSLQPTCGSSSGGSELEVAGLGFPSSSARIHDFEAQPFVRQALYAAGKLVYSTKLQGRMSMNEAKNPVVTCRTQVLPAHLFSMFSFVEMATDISFSGVDGPFTRTQLPFRVYRPLACKKIEPSTRLVPGKKSGMVLSCSNLGANADLHVRIRCTSSIHPFGKITAFPEYELLGAETIKLQLPFFTLRESGRTIDISLASPEETSQAPVMRRRLWTQQRRISEKARSLEPITKGTVEISLNGYDWFERASLPVTFLPPARVSHCTPSFGSLRGGTAIEVHGEHFALGRCWVGFLTRPRSEAAASSKRAFLSSLSDETHFSKAAICIQSKWRRTSVRIATRCGTALPCCIVPAFAISSNLIKCETPRVLLPDDTTVVLSANGLDFEYVSAQLINSQMDSKCQANFRFQHDASIYIVESADGFTTDHIYIRGEGYHCPSTDAITVRFRAPPVGIAKNSDGDDNDDDASSSTSHSSRNSEGIVTFARAVMMDQHTLSCYTPTSLPYRALHRISVALNGVDFSEEIDLMVQNSPAIERLEPEWMLTTRKFTLSVVARNISERDTIVVKFMYEDYHGSLHEVIRLAGEVVVSSEKNITCEVPILEPILAPLRIGDGILMVDIGAFNGEKFTENPLKLHISSKLPEVSSCLPVQGPPAGGTVRIHGKGFCDKKKITVRLIPVPTGLFDSSTNVDLSSFEIEPLVMEYGAQYVGPTVLKCELPELNVGTEYFIQVSFNHRDFTKTTRYCTYKCITKNQASESTSLDGGNVKRAMRNFKQMKGKLKDVGLSKLKSNLASNPYCEIDYEGTIDSALNNLGSKGVAYLKKTDLKVVEQKQQIDAIDPRLLQASTMRQHRAKQGPQHSLAESAAIKMNDTSVLEQMHSLAKHNPEETKRLLQKTFQTLAEPGDEELPAVEHAQISKASIRREEQAMTSSGKVAAVELFTKTDPDLPLKEHSNSETRRSIEKREVSEKQPIPPRTPQASKAASRQHNPARLVAPLKSPRTTRKGGAKEAKDKPAARKARGRESTLDMSPEPPTSAQVEMAPEPTGAAQTLTFDQLCKQGITQLFPGATQMDLMEVWSVADPGNTGEVTLDQLMMAITSLGKNNTEIGPGDYDIYSAKDKFSRRDTNLPVSLYERPASLLVRTRKPGVRRP